MLFTCFLVKPRRTRRATQVPTNEKGARTPRCPTPAHLLGRSASPGCGAAEEEPREGLGLRHEGRDLDPLLLRVEAAAARAEPVDRRDADGGRGARVRAAAEQRRLGVAEARGARARAVLGAERHVGGGPLEGR